MSLKNCTKYKCIKVSSPIKKKRRKKKTEKTKSSDTPDTERITDTNNQFTKGAQKLLVQNFRIVVMFFVYVNCLHV